MTGQNPKPRVRRNTVSPSEYAAWRQGIQNDWRVLAKAPYAMRVEVRLVLEAQRQNWRALQYAPEELKSDTQFYVGKR
eukprot:CAMPEP_0115132562 /NCGR_PEP_ID=MMETSP0227-20121206/53831_1 /TAXON_ID=89957 /ORGANISM="Polarella glacialis, Strain CCMP 1383" /LENGTH=77 /DNA_ID=CAMNT_0002538387 /DNA_START=79 /DNA_END=309 /DNA_ORIENTATION=-